MQEGIVTQNGTIPGLTSKRLAGVMAWWVPGIRDVVNGIEISPPEEDSADMIEEAIRVTLDRTRLSIQARSALGSATLG